MSERLVRSDFACQLCRVHQNRGLPAVTVIGGFRLCAHHHALLLSIIEHPSPDAKPVRPSRRRMYLVRVRG